jgi:hypothetical protein
LSHDDEAKIAYKPKPVTASVDLQKHMEPIVEQIQQKVLARTNEVNLFQKQIIALNL